MKTHQLFAGISIALTVAACGGASAHINTDPPAPTTPAPTTPPPVVEAPPPNPMNDMKLTKRVEVSGDHIVIKEKIQFEQGKAAIKAESNALLDEIGKVFADHPEIKKVEIQGHASGEGDPKVNLKLSDERSKSVMAALVQRSVKADVLTAKGYGSEKKLAEEKTEDDREKNRRVEFLITDPKAQKGGLKAAAAAAKQQ